MKNGSHYRVRSFYHCKFTVENATATRPRVERDVRTEVPVRDIVETVERRGRSPPPAPGRDSFPRPDYS